MAKIECSDYLKNKIDAMSELIEQLNTYFDYASILGCDTKGKSFMVNRGDMTLKDYAGNECGFVVRVLKNGRYFEYSFNEWLEVEDLYTQMIQLYKEDEQIQKEAHLENYDQIQCNDAMVYEGFDKNVQKTIGETGIPYVLDELTKARDKALAYDKRIMSIAIVFNQVHVSKVFIAPNKELHQGYMYSELVCQATCKEGQKVQREYKVVSGLKGVEILDELDKLVNETCRASLEMLSSLPMVPGTYEVICAPDVSGLIAHEAFGHGVEMDMFVKNRALAKDYIGQMVASSLVTMVDGARPKQEVASYLFDDEGNLGQETILIKNGVLQAGISDEASAIRLGAKPTGNGRRESFERKAYARMTNTYFEKGTSKVEDMIASIRYGFLLEGASSGMEDPKHWGIQCIITKAREIVDGELTGKIFAPVILTGYVPDLLKSITMVSDEVKLSGGGSCGKGHKEWVKVSDGGPYLKAKARLG